MTEITQTIRMKVSGQNITGEQCPLCLASNTVNYVRAEFELDDAWDQCDLVKSVWYTHSAQIVALISDGACIVPHEVLSTQAKVFVNLFGMVYENGSEKVRITSYPYSPIRVDGFARLDGDETTPITPSQFEQFVNLVIDETKKVTDMQAVAETLPTGSDATASYSDGVLTLGIPRGVKGDTGERGERGLQGEQGLPGVPGADGYSPTATVTKTGDTATITITDKNGTTTASISDGSGADIDVDSELSSTSTNPVQNKVITTALSGKANTADLATVATSGSYADLSNKPTIPTVPTNVSAFTNDAHYITSAGAPVQSVNGQTGAVTVTDTDTTYTLSMSGNVITLTPSSGTATSVTLPVYAGGVSA